MEYAFHFNNSMAETGLYMALKKCLGPLERPPVVLCIGSDLDTRSRVDSLGPIAGTMLRRRAFNGYVYGTLKNPVTAKEAKYLGEFLKKTHPRSKIIAVDAAVGEEPDIGLLKVLSGALRPGAGANKRLPKVGGRLRPRDRCEKNSALLSALSSDPPRRRLFDGRSRFGGDLRSPF